MKPCAVCGTKILGIGHNIYCKECAHPIHVCKVCGKGFRLQFRTSNQTCCGLSCNTKWMHSIPEIQEHRRRRTVIGLKRFHAAHPEVAQRMSQWSKAIPRSIRIKMGRKVSATLKRIGHRPKIRGGNGTGPTKAEKVLMSLFSKAVWNYGIKTGKWNGSGYPPVYKVDLAFPKQRLAIEADGACHGLWDNRNVKDQKKDAFLAGLGWRVLRFSNKEILNQPQQVRLSIISRLKSIPLSA